MLIVNGFFENGVFVPEKPLVNITGRQKATLTIAEDEEKEHQKQIMAWREFGEAVLNSNETLEGEPERFQFRMFTELS